nr:TolC family protein [uncultured Arsenicibacter sp.]
MNRIHIIVLFALSSLTAVAQTAVAQTLPDDLRTLMQQANTNFPRLKEQEQQVKAGEIRRDIVRTTLLPTIQGNGSYQYINPVPQATFPINGQDVALKFVPHHNVNANIGINVPIYDWGRTKEAIRKAQDDILLARHNVELTQHNLGFQVAAAYYGIGFLQKSLAVQDSVIQTASANIQTIVNRLRNGDALEFDVLTQKVRLETAKNRKVDIQNQLDRQLALLTYLTGNPSPAIGPDAMQFSTVTGPLSVADAQYQAALSGNKELVIAQDRVRQAESEIRASELNGRPTLGFGGNVGFKNGYIPDVNTPKFNQAAGVSLVVPIYSGKRNALQTEAARVSLTASKYAVENANAQLRQSLAQLNADMKAYQARLQNLETQLLQAGKALDIARARLKNGVITAVELESAETGVEEARLTQLSVQYQILLSQLELKRLLGESL